MGLGARCVMAILFLLSIWSVAIMIDRRRVFKNEIGSAKTEEAKKLIRANNWDLLKSWADNNPSFLAGVVLSALSVNTKGSDSVDRAVQSYLSDKRLKLERGLNVLATLGSNAPFIGLFGTVLGIIQSFGILASQQGSAMTAVMLGLAESLIATAIGLFVAIPAVIAYNYFGQRLRNLTLEAHSVRDLMISTQARS
jgi:biopolymer transport protein ExbB/TolQ